MDYSLLITDQLNKYQSLYLSRQFILAPEEINESFHCNKYPLSNGYILYSHKNLPVTIQTNRNDFVLLLGNIFSSLDIHATNKSIICELASYSIEELLSNKIKYYSGRYVIVVKNKKDLFLLNDASAHRKVYYTKNTDKIWCASQPHILAKLLGIKISNNPEKSNFYNSRQFLDRGLCGILNDTPYDEILQLTPNKLLNLHTKKVTRFWPADKISVSPIASVYKESAKLLKNIITNASERFDLMLPVTAGRDSRLLLAASKEVQDKILFYTNKNNYEKQDHCDIKIPKKIFKNIECEHHIIRYDNECPQEFEDIVKKNILFSYNKYNTLFYQVYYKQYPDRLNMPGICGEITYKWANRGIKKYDGYSLAEFFHFHNNEYVSKQYQIWLDEVLELCNKCNIPPLTLFFWEEIICNWAIHISQMKDIAQDEFYPMNFTALQEILFSAPIKYRDYYSNYLFKGLINYMRPEIAGISFNPTWKFKLIILIKKLRLYPFAKKISCLFHS